LKIGTQFDGIVLSLVGTIPNFPMPATLLLKTSSEALWYAGVALSVGANGQTCRSVKPNVHSSSCKFCCTEAGRVVVWRARGVSLWLVELASETELSYNALQVFQII
jgi:hypothetical protein